MSRGACTFRQRDVAAAVKAVRAAGCEVMRVEVNKDGKIAVITKADDRPPAAESGQEEEIIL